MAVVLSIVFMKDWWEVLKVLLAAATYEGTVLVQPTIVVILIILIRAVVGIMSITVDFHLQHWKTKLKELEQMRYMETPQRKLLTTALEVAAAQLDIPPKRVSG